MKFISSTALALSVALPLASASPVVERALQRFALQVQVLEGQGHPEFNGKFLVPQENGGGDNDVVLSRNPATLIQKGNKVLFKEPGAFDDIALKLINNNGAHNQAAVKAFPGLEGPGKYVFDAKNELVVENFHWNGWVVCNGDPGRDLLYWLKRPTPAIVDCAKVSLIKVRL